MNLMVRAYKDNDGLKREEISSNKKMKGQEVLPLVYGRVNTFRGRKKPKEGVSNAAIGQPGMTSWTLVERC